MTQWIAHDVDLSAHMEGPEFAPKVRPASDFAEQVKACLRGDDNEPRHPTMLLSKARGIEFRPGEVTAWVGFNGHRKSMFTSQVALDLCAQKRKALIVSLEMAPKDTLARMVRQAHGTRNPGDRNVDWFHSWADGKLWLFDHIGELEVAKALALCRYFQAELGGTDVFLDSMMMICTSEERLDEQKRFSTGLVRLAQETGLHVHVITHCRKPNSGDEAKLPGRYDIRGSAAISDQAHNVMVVWMNKAKYAKLEEFPGDMDAHAEPCAVVKCDKQRNGKWEGKIKLWNDERSLRFCEDRTTPVEPYHLFAEQ
jgi:twinkle protein